MKKVLFALALYSAAFLPGQASAEEQPAGPSVKVFYHDLDLSTAAGRASLRRRVKAAVWKVCPHRQAIGVAASAARQQCLRDTAADADRQLLIAIARAAGNQSGNDAIAAR